MNFSIQKVSTKSEARTGLLLTAHGEVPTPAFMPIATKGAVKTIGSDDLKRLGADIVLSNTYHLMLRPGEELLTSVGGLHKFMGWSGPILTDSGGYQVLSLAKMRKVVEDGVLFQSPIDGARHLLSPEKSMDVQSAIGSDIAMILDELIDYPADCVIAKAALDRTIRWAERAKKHGVKGQLFGIVQGSTYADLRRESAERLVEIGFDGYAHGGLSVGESREESCKLTSIVNNLLPQTLPRYWMGAGQPEEIVEYVRRGCDMFDCVLPTRNARHGTLYVWTGDDLSDKFYEMIHITNEKHRLDFSVLDPHCDCPTCASGVTRAYLRHLFIVEEPLAARLATLHNVRFYLRLMERIREGISTGKL